MTINKEEKRKCPKCGGYLHAFANDETFELWIECSTHNCGYNANAMPEESEPPDGYEWVTKNQIAKGKIEEYLGGPPSQGYKVWHFWNWLGREE